MPGQGQPFTTLGTGKDTVFNFVLVSQAPATPSYALSVRADKNNASAFKLGRGSAFEPFYANDSRTYYSCKTSDLVFNDNGTAGLILYVDDSGPMAPGAQYVVVVPGPCEMSDAVL